MFVQEQIEETMSRSELCKQSLAFPTCCGFRIEDRVETYTKVEGTVGYQDERLRLGKPVNCCYSKTKRPTNVNKELWVGV